jgi:ATP/maltotriose-dependent transcriptional regulator MalT
MARYLGLLAATAGRLDEAERCCEEALAANRDIDAVLYEAWTQWDYACVLARRGRAGAARAAAVAAQARETAQRLGLGRLLGAMQHSAEPMPLEPGAT